MTEPGRAIAAGSPLSGHLIHLVGAAAVLGGLAAAGYPPRALYESPWGLPLIVINVAILAANLTIGNAETSAGETELVTREGRELDLERSRQLVVDQLRALELERDKLSAEDYAREREELLSVGASALRALEEGDADELGEPATVIEDPLLSRLRMLRDSASPEAWRAALAALGEPTGRPVAAAGGEWRGAGYTLLGVALVGLLYSMAGDNAADRRNGAPMTGGETAMGQAAEPMPADLNGLNVATERAIAGGDLGRAMTLNAKAVEMAPTDPGARVFQAALQAFVGMTDRALAGLDEVLADHPDHVRALVYKGLIALDSDRPTEAVAALERALTVQGPNDQLQAALEKARALAEGRPVPEEAPPAPPAAPEVVLSGTLTLDPARAAALTGKEVLFVSVRSPAGGPPLAALRLAPGPFPLAFQITTADAIAMGGPPRPFPEALMLTARVDADGDPMSRSDADPSATLPEVTRGSTGLEIALQ